MPPVFPSVVSLTYFMGHTAVITQVEHDAVFWIRLCDILPKGAGGAIRELSVALPVDTCLQTPF